MLTPFGIFLNLWYLFHHPLVLAVVCDLKLDDVEAVVLLGQRGQLRGGAGIPGG